MAQTGTSGTGDRGNSETLSRNLKPHKKSRKYIFTENNYDENSLEVLEQKLNKYKYIFGREVGESGTPHLQGYIEAKNPISFNTIQKILPRAHITAAKGSIKENFKYCSKDGDYKTNIDLETFQQRLMRQCLTTYQDVVWKE